MGNVRNGRSDFGEEDVEQAWGPGREPEGIRGRREAGTLGRSREKEEWKTELSVDDVVERTLGMR